VYGTSTDFSSAGSAGSSPSHIGHVFGGRITGIRLWRLAHSSFGIVVTMVNDRIVSFARDRHVSHKPASAYEID
jgi:hypothetical protein